MSYKFSFGIPKGKFKKSVEVGSRVGGEGSCECKSMRHKRKFTRRA